MDISYSGKLVGFYGAIAKDSTGNRIINSIINNQIIYESSFVGIGDNTLSRRNTGSFFINEKTAYFLDKEILKDSISYSSDIEKAIVDATCFINRNQAKNIIETLNFIDSKAEKILILDEPVPIALEFLHYFDTVSVDLRVFDALFYSVKPMDVAQEKSIQFIIKTLEDWRSYSSNGMIQTGRSYNCDFDFILQN